LLLLYSTPPLLRYLLGLTSILVLRWLWNERVQSGEAVAVGLFGEGEGCFADNVGSRQDGGLVVQSQFHGGYGFDRGLNQRFID
jgi:hypothetical protein